MSIEKHDLGFELLSDSSMTTAMQFGLAFHPPESLVEKYLENDLDIEGASGMKHHILPVPAVFLVDMNGVVRFAYVNPNYRVRLDADALLAAAADLKAAGGAR